MLFDSDMTYTLSVNYSENGQSCTYKSHFAHIQTVEYWPGESLCKVNVFTQGAGSTMCCLFNLEVTFMV